MVNYWDEIQMESPYVYMRTQTDDGTALPVMMHSHIFYEIVFCSSGHIQYLLGNERFCIQPGDIVLIPPGLSHQPLFPPHMEEPYTRYILWINDAYWNSCLEQCPDLGFAFEQCKRRGSYLLRSTRATWSGLFTAAAGVLKEQEQRRIGWEICTQCTAILLMAHLSRTYYYQDIADPAAEKSDLMDDIFRYIDMNLDKKITLEDVAQRFLVSKSTISHLSKTHYHVSFYRCILQRRLIAAKNSILSGTPLSKVWETCGFSDYTAFYRAFKKEYGISPKEFKKKSGGRGGNTDGGGGT